MRQLWSVEGRSSDWDNNIPSNVKENWIRFFQELFVMESISFKRYTHQKQLTVLVLLFSVMHACEQDFEIGTYVRWKLSNGKFDNRLLAAKGRVAPLKNY